MANCNPCDQPTTSSCTDCSDVPLITSTYCNEGCVDTISSDCVRYDGEDIVTTIFNIQNGDNLTDVIVELAKNLNTVDIELTFNSTTRSLCLLKNDAVVQCVTISDKDDQYLVLTEEKVLQIWKTASPSDIMINEVDLSSVFTETPLEVTSDTLTIAQNPNNSHDISIDISPSSDLGNILILGTDNKPYVPDTGVAVSNVVIQNGNCITWVKTFANEVITFVPTIDWTCVAAQVCELCAPSCSVPTNLNVENI